MNKDKQKIGLGIEPSELDDLNRKTSGKILGLDYGSKNVGIAISDREQKQAFVYETLNFNHDFFKKLKQIIKDELIDKIVVGLPLSMSGKYSRKTEEVVQFIELVEKQTKLIVETVDERMSTIEAKKRKDGHQIDASSAQIILQQYLDSPEIGD